MEIHECKNKEELTKLFRDHTATLRAAGIEYDRIELWTTFLTLAKDMK